MLIIREVFFLPPMAVARLGGSETPLDAFTWAEDPTVHGAAKTVIVPTVSLEVMGDGSLRPFLPREIRFRDGDQLRPVAPFFELHALVEDSDGKTKEVALTPAVLEEAGSSFESVRYCVSAANLKAQRRTGDVACGFAARLTVRADDHVRHPLLASSPHRRGTEPLVSADRPIPLGAFQSLRPGRLAADALPGLDLSCLRVRFTPARGAIYGPVEATVGEAPGSRRSHEIVPAANRILNSAAAWSRYDASYAAFDNPEPSDTYDGADIDDGRSWGVVDDSCDAIIEAFVVAGGRRLRAAARVFVGPPDFAPDRRPFFTLVDDLADREELHPSEAPSLEEVADLFQRVFETVSLFNVEAQRTRTLSNNAANIEAAHAANQSVPTDVPPHFGPGSMTATDRPFASHTADLGGPEAPKRAAGHLWLSDIARAVHAPFADVELLADFLRHHGDRVRQILRPPWGALEELMQGRDCRDPRVLRDGLHDMRMPSYMRDSDALPLSLSRRQYAAVLEVLERLGPVAHGLKASGGQPLATPVERHVARVVARAKKNNS